MNLLPSEALGFISISEAIKFLEEGPAGIFCDFQPGNGTRYIIGLTRLSVGPSALECCGRMVEYDYPKTRKACGGIAKNGWLFTWINAKRCCVLQPDGYLSPDFLSQKLGGVSHADAIVLSKLISHLSLRQAMD